MKTVCVCIGFQRRHYEQISLYQQNDGQSETWY